MFHLDSLQYFLSTGKQSCNGMTEAEHPLSQSVNCLRVVLFLLTHELRSFTPALYSSPLLCKILLWKLVKYKPEILEFVLLVIFWSVPKFYKVQTTPKWLAQTFRQKFSDKRESGQILRICFQERSVRL